MIASLKSVVYINNLETKFRQPLFQLFLFLLIINHYRVLVYDPVKPVCKRPYIIYEMEKRKKVESHLFIYPSDSNLFVLANMAMK